MKIPRYGMFLWWSAEDGAFVVDVPELPGCMAHGATRAVAIVFWLKTANADGIPVPQTKGRLLVA